MTWEDKLDFDLLYVQNISIMTDLFIIRKQSIRSLYAMESRRKDKLQQWIWGDYMLVNGMIHKDDYSALQKEAKRLLDSINIFEINSL